MARMLALSSIMQINADEDICPGVGTKCSMLGADGLGCCGAELGPGFAFCQTNPDYLCCSGASYAITCDSHSTECEVDDAGLPNCVPKKVLEESNQDEDICPGVGKKCSMLGADGLGCCGAELGPGFAFCQTNPDYLCCSGASYAITCDSHSTECEVDDAGLPNCVPKKALEESNQDEDICPGVGKKCSMLGADGLGCCGAELGPGFAFCQTNPDYLCCSGASYAITCDSHSQECEVDDAGLPNCVNKALEESNQDEDICPGVGKKCSMLGADGLGCCGAELGPGFAFCQTNPDYLCCSGASYAITCDSHSTECEVDDAGLPNCVPKSGTLGDFVCAGVNYNITCGSQFTACCGEGTIAPLCMDAGGHSCCVDDELNLAVTCEKDQTCNKGPQCTAPSIVV